MQYITVGIDEVGRGSWAGPVVAGAVVLPRGHGILGLRDSKKLTKRQRETLTFEIKRRASAVGLGWVDATEVDKHGLSWAVQQSGLRALADLGVAFHEVLLDGRHDYFANEDFASQAIIRGDDSVPEISAAAIVAKVARDRFMAVLGSKYENYGFADHVGYGTARHRKALRIYGPTPLHRCSYRPVAEVLA